MKRHLAETFWWPQRHKLPPLSKPGLRSRRFLGGVGFLNTLGVGFSCPTPDVQLDHFFYITLLKWVFLWKWYNFFWNFYWNRDFLLCTTISIDFNSQVSFLYGVGSRKFWKGRSCSVFFPRLRKPGRNKTERENPLLGHWALVDRSKTIGKKGLASEAINWKCKYRKRMCWLVSGEIIIAALLNKHTNGHFVGSDKYLRFLFAQTRAPTLDHFASAPRMRVGEE